MDWHGLTLMRRIDAALHERLHAVGMGLSADLKQSINVRVGRKVSGLAPTAGNLSRIRKRGATIKKKDYIPSRPGEPPHKRTGRLQSSVTYEVSGPVVRVGTNVVYGRYLELGTSKMPARPWLRPGLSRNADRIARLLGGRIKGL